MAQLDDTFSDYLATAVEMLDAEGMPEASALLRAADCQVEQTGYDNWDGGTTIWTIHLLVEPAEYARLGAEREVLQEQIMNRLKPILEQFSRDWYSVKIQRSRLGRIGALQARGSLGQLARRSSMD